MKNIASLIIALSLLFGAAIPARAVEAPSPAPVSDTVTTCQELVGWAREHAVTGGTVWLGADILWEPGAWLNTEGQITVEMGAYGITVPSGTTLSALGPFLFQGAGDTDRTLFLVEDGGVLLLDEPSIIKAQGDGVTAVRVLWPNGIQCSYASILAYGNGAVGVDAPNGLETGLLSVYLEGDGALAIASGGSTSLQYCDITAVGEGAYAIQSSSPILLDNVHVSPYPQDAQAVNRIFNMSAYIRNTKWLSSFYTQVGETVTLPSFVEGTMEPLTEGGSSYSLRADIVWDTSSVDINTPGRYPCIGKLIFPLPNIPIQGGEPLDVCAYVVDSELPHLINYREVSGRGILDFLSPVSEAYTRELWGTGDGGNSWTQISIYDNPVSDKSVSFKSPFLYINSYQFQLVLRDGDSIMSSNILDVTVSELGFFANDIGGERQGTDRGEGIERPNPPDLGDQQEPEPPAPVSPFNPQPGPPVSDGSDMPKDEPNIQPTPEPPIEPAPTPPLEDAPPLSSVSPGITADTSEISTIPNTTYQMNLSPIIPSTLPAADRQDAPESTAPSPQPTPIETHTAQHEATTYLSKPAEKGGSSPPPTAPSKPLMRRPTLGLVSASLALLGVGLGIGILTWRRRNP